MRRHVSRRQAIKAGVGAVVLTATGFSARGAFAGSISSPSDPLVSEVGQVTAVDGTTVTAATGSGGTLAATLLGFPVGVAPRPGDLVSVMSRADVERMTSEVDGVGRCAEPAAAVETDELVAAPLCRWVTGVPMLAPGGGVSVGGVPIAGSPEVRQAAVRRQAVSVCTMDSQLRDRQVLEVRTTGAA